MEDPSWLSLLALGVPIRLRCSDVAVLGRLRHLLDDLGGVVPADAGAEITITRRGPEWTVEDGEAVASATSEDSAVGAALAAVNRRAVYDTPYHAFHAGAVSAGQAVVGFPGPSGQGKSTLVAACLQTGFNLVSDEALCFDHGGRVIPYPRPLSLSRASADLLGLPWTPGRCELVVTARDLSSGVVRSRGPLEHVVLFERRPGPPELLAASRGQVVAALLPRSFTSPRDPRAAFEQAVRVAATAHPWQLRYEKPVQAADLLRRAFSALLLDKWDAADDPAR